MLNSTTKDIITNEAQRAVFSDQQTFITASDAFGVRETSSKLWSTQSASSSVDICGVNVQNSLFEGTIPDPVSVSLEYLELWLRDLSRNCD